MEHTAWLFPIQTPGFEDFGSSNAELWSHTDFTLENTTLCLPSEHITTRDSARLTASSNPSVEDSIALGQPSAQLYQSHDLLRNPVIPNCTDLSTLPVFPHPATSDFNTMNQDFPNITPPISGRVMRGTMSSTSQTPVATEPTKRSFTTYNCGTPGCAVLPFQTKAAWRRHMIRHDGRFKCKATSCQSLRAFSTSNDLDRHRRSVHGEGPVLFCRVPTCKYAEGGAKKGFARLDNLRAHMRREHPTLDPETAVANPVQKRHVDAQPIEHRENPVREARSPPALPPAPDDGSPSFSPDANAAGIGTVVPVAEQRSLQEENVRLQERVSKLESENDMLWRLIDSLRKN